jgi:hypothetical protein
MILDLAPQIRGSLTVTRFNHIQTVVVVDQQIISMILKQQPTKGGLDVLGVVNLNHLVAAGSTWGHIPNSSNLSHDSYKYFSYGSG